MLSSEPLEVDLAELQISQCSICYFCGVFFTYNVTLLSIRLLISSTVNDQVFEDGQFPFTLIASYLLHEEAFICLDIIFCWVRIKNSIFRVPACDSEYSAYEDAFINDYANFTIPLVSRNK